MGNKMGSSWEVVTSKKDPLRASLVERARKRTVRPKTDRNWWAVSGSQSLGDAYDSYDVHLHEDGTYYCSCTGSTGGEYRRDACSHRTAIILWRQEHDDPWEAEDFNEQDGTFMPFENSDETITQHDPPLSSELEGEGVDGSIPSPALPDAMATLASDFDPFSLDWDEPPSPQELAHHHSDSPLPAKFVDFRPDQWHGIIEAVEALDDGVKCVFLAAPTGTGKSLVAASIPQIMGIPFIYTCTTHTLQEQVLSEFEYAKVLKGRRNYKTLDDPSITADDCTMARVKLPACSNCPGYTVGSTWNQYTDDESDMDDRHGRHCHHCHPWEQCPYRVAKADAKESRFAVLNTAYFLTHNNLAGGQDFGGWDLVIIDEADQIERELMDHITVEITPRMRKYLGVGLPEKKTVEESWVDWVRDEVLPAIKARINERPVRQDLFGKPDLEDMRRQKGLKSLRAKLQMLLKPIPGSEDDSPALLTGWVYTGYEKADKSGEDKLDENVTVQFKPITVADYARDYLWAHAKQFVLMSATLFPEQDAAALGLEDGEWAVVEIPSSFPKERRPIIASRAEASVTQKTERTAYPILIRQLLEIMEEHSNERILVHSNSYKLTRELFFETRKRSSDARERVITYLYPNERQTALSRYLAHPRGVLIAPSFERGVDLQGDDCRVVVIAKVPFPYLGDKQISARLYGTGRQGKIWYTVETIRSICQMTGRGMRSKDDWCISYILDRQFYRIFGDNQRLFPGWWREAVIFDENDPQWRDALRELRAM